MLVRFGCHYGQGFYFDRPMAESRFNDELHRRGAERQNPPMCGDEAEDPRESQCLSPLPSTADLAEFINNSPHAFIIIGREGSENRLSIQYASPSLFTVTGFDVNALNAVIARNVDDVLSVDGYSDFSCALNKARECGCPVDVPFVLEHPSRGTISLQAYIWTAQNQKIHMIIHLSDRFCDGLTENLFSEKIGPA